MEMDAAARAEDVVWAAASALDADALGGVFRRDEDGLIQVGFNRNAGAYGAELRATLPDMPLLVVAVKHSNVRLLEIQDEIADLMSDDAMGDGIFSVGGHDHDDFLLVGVADPDSAVARDLVRRYGDAVAIFKDEPLDLL